MVFSKFQFKTPRIPFLKWRYGCMAISALLLLACVGSIAIKGFNFGIDFTGGTVLEISFNHSTDPEAIKNLLEENEIQVQVIHFGTSDTILIRTQEPNINAQLSESIFTIIQTKNPSATINRVEFVGPQVGKELIEDGSLATIYALLGILIYVAFRFQWRFGLSALLTLAHDTLVVAGLFSIFNWQFDLTVLAAVLATIGYSLNDTIVIFDRVRENFALKSAKPFETINTSLNQTLSRTLMTSITTLLVLICLLVLGGSGLFNFSLALTLGVLVGTYSSIFIACPLLLELKVDRLHLFKEEDANLKNTI